MKHLIGLIIQSSIFIAIMAWLHDVVYAFFERQGFVFTSIFLAIFLTVCISITIHDQWNRKWRKR